MRTPFPGPSMGPAEGRLALGMCLEVAPNERRQLPRRARGHPESLTPSRTQVTPPQREHLWELSARSPPFLQCPALLPHLPPGGWGSGGLKPRSSRTGSVSPFGHLFRASCLGHRACGWEPAPGLLSSHDGPEPPPPAHARPCLPSPISFPPCPL